MKVLVVTDTRGVPGRFFGYASPRKLPSILSGQAGVRMTDCLGFRPEDSPPSSSSVFPLRVILRSEATKDLLIANDAPQAALLQWGRGVENAQ
jgi:hypothetical protein